MTGFFTSALRPCCHVVRWAGGVRQDVSPPIETSGGGSESVAPAGRRIGVLDIESGCANLESVFGMPEDPSQPVYCLSVLGYAPETSWEFGVKVVGVLRQRQS